MAHRKMPAYGEREHGGRYILDDYCWSRNHCRAATIRRWKRNLKKKARAKTRMQLARWEEDSGNGKQRMENRGYMFCNHE
ncbi:hypothetical protein [Mediterraneibacter agrestimuris]|uniref:hypothetical protein n=1 Tax=Mediterraneibacter agrestimuris TaxID=2941333 RepID=UPI00203CD903|nr:hypothetical protein [Mediterraneibacter agrestimuris]